MIWSQLTSPEIAALNRAAVVVLPLAATEQHGPHLPLATDLLIAEGICHALHQALPKLVLILPCPPVGYSAHHRGFAGTLSVPHEVLINYAAGMAESVIADGFKSLLILNAHGGNVALGGVLLEQLGERNPGAQIVFASWWQAAAGALRGITASGPGGTGHACEFETSLLLYLHPELVHRAEIAPGTNQPTHAWAETNMLHGSSARLQRNFSQMTTNGVFGDPTLASPEKGKAILDVVVASLSTMVGDLL